MTKAVRIHEPGGADVLKYEDVELAPPGPGEARIDQKAVGLNFIDVYHRSGLYPLPSLPWIIGMEGAGVVTALGAGVEHLNSGDRVAYAAAPPGGYAEARNINAAHLVKLPADITFEQGAAMMLQGMTAEYLLLRTYPVKPGDTILVHAAAGGVGLIQCQWAQHLGATVIGTVGSEEKAALARAHGCHHTINYKTENFAERVQEITDGQGVPVVYDSVCKDTFMDSLACLKRRGLLVNFGQSSGPLENFNIATLTPKSLFVTRPSLFSYIATPDELERSAKALFGVVRSGAVKIEVRQSYPLAATAQAHRDLEARKTTGSTVLIP